MAEVTEVPKPLDAALDLLLYAPVGLAVTAAEELPKMAAKGRTRVNTQLMMARVVGQFAVARGRQEFEKRFSPPAPQPPVPVPVPDADVEPPVTFDDMTANGSANGKGIDRSESVASEHPDEVRAPTADDVAVAAAPSAGELAIPGYDSLSASQVVQRLAGLSSEELAAVGAYEQAHRGRRTILNRIHQLQGQ